MRTPNSRFVVAGVALCLTLACDVGTAIDVGESAEHTSALDGGTVDPPPSACDLDLGNFDCPDGTGCVDYGVVEGYGECEPNAHGESSLYVLCSDNDDCYGGLCVDGVCSHPCSYDPCPGGYQCDESGDVASGVCRPVRCDDPGICDEGFSCVSSETDQPVCAKGAGGCSATGIPPGSTPPPAMFALTLFAFALRRKR